MFEFLLCREHIKINDWVKHLVNKLRSWTQFITMNFWQQDNLIQWQIQANPVERNLTGLPQSHVISLALQSCVTEGMSWIILVLFVQLAVTDETLFKTTSLPFELRARILWKWTIKSCSHHCYKWMITLSYNHSYWQKHFEETECSLEQIRTDLVIRNRSETVNDPRDHTINQLLSPRHSFPTLSPCETFMSWPWHLWYSCQMDSTVTDLFEI
jgi:hypothetical protein